MDGGCSCGSTRYRLEGPPLIVHACHCTWCQRETGSVHAWNAVYEAERVTHIAAAPEVIHTPSASGKGQHIARCAICKVAIWSNYAGSGAITRFVRVGTMDRPADHPPDLHIFTATKLPWVILPACVPAFAEFYDIEKLWPAASLERRRIMRARAHPP